MSAAAEPCDLSLVDAAALLRAGSLSSLELTQSALARIEKTEPALHAYVVVLPEQALAAAQLADRERAAGTDRGPLHGIPIAIKDIFDLAGVPTRCGSRQREHVGAAPTDAVSVARALAAGAVPLGKTVTQEFAAGVVSPPARNPWDPSRIPGGSSGGSAAAVAAGSAIAAFGSDTGGSIRCPAAVCGVTGLKPTFGTIDTGGVYPLAWSLDTVGPIGKSAEDCAIFYDALRDDRSAPPSTAEIGTSLRGVRIGIERDYWLRRVAPDVPRAFEQAIEIFNRLGASLVNVSWPEAGLASAAALVINRVETLGVHDATLRDTPELFGPELRMRLEATSLLPAAGFMRATRIRRIVRESIARLYRDLRLDALVVPTLPCSALPADDLFVTYPDGSREGVMLAYNRLTRPFNLTGQPALQVPCGFDANGLPIGLQIVGRPFAETRVISIGHAYEREAGWYSRRPPIPPS